MPVLIDASPPSNPNTAEVMYWRRTFLGLPEEARRTRHFIGFLLADFPEVSEVVNATGELVANALQHSRSGAPGGKITVEVGRWVGCLAIIAVTDQGGPSEPRRRKAGGIENLLEESGRGLNIVDAISACWAWSGDIHSRTVTALFLDQTK